MCNTRTGSQLQNIRANKNRNSLLITEKMSESAQIWQTVKQE